LVSPYKAYAQLLRGQTPLIKLEDKQTLLQLCKTGGYFFNSGRVERPFSCFCLMPELGPEGQTVVSFNFRGVESLTANVSYWYLKPTKTEDIQS
jgi:hypothetical protein